MKEAIVKFRLVTPAFLAGADQNFAEMRVPSIRGMLRKWFRFLYANDPCLDKMEHDLFGWVDNKSQQGRGESEKARKSKLLIQNLTSYKLSVISSSKHFDWIIALQTKIKRRQPLSTNEQLKREKMDLINYFAWPLIMNNRGAVAAGQIIKLRLKMLKKSLYEDQLKNTIKIFLLLGCLGNRSHCGYGSVWPEEVVFSDTKIDDDKGKEVWNYPKNGDEFNAQIGELLKIPNIYPVYQISEPMEKADGAQEMCMQFLRMYRCGSDRYGGVPLIWGDCEHFNGVHLKSGTPNYRILLGAPLKQTFTEKDENDSPKRPTITYFIDKDGNLPKIDRLPSPILFKVIPLNEGFIPIYTFYDRFRANSKEIIPEKVKGHVENRHQCLNQNIDDELFRKLKEDPSLNEGYIAEDFKDDPNLVEEFCKKNHFTNVKPLFQPVEK